MARPLVALVIPTLNEEEAIGGVIAAVPRAVVDDIIVVDSGSTDRTAENARAAGARLGGLPEPAGGRRAPGCASLKCRSRIAAALAGPRKSRATCAAQSWRAGASSQRSRASPPSGASVDPKP